MNDKGRMSVIITGRQFLKALFYYMLLPLGFYHHCHKSFVLDPVGPKQKVIETLSVVEIFPTARVTDSAIFRPKAQG